LEPAATELDVFDVAKASPRGLQHRRRVVHGDDAANARRERVGHLAGAAAEIADDRVVVEEPEQREQMEAASEELLTETVPLSCRRREELLRFRPTRREH